MGSRDRRTKELEVLLGYPVSSESKPSERKVGEGQGREAVGGGGERHNSRKERLRLDYHKHQRAEIQRKGEKREPAEGPKLVGVKQTFAQCVDVHRQS